MRYYRSRFFSALSLLDSYQYPEPFHVSVKKFFKGKKKYGSKDRKAISQICYTYLRTGNMFNDLTSEEGLLLSGLYLDWDDVKPWNSLSKELKLKHHVDQSSRDIYLHSLGYAPNYYPKDVVMEEFRRYLDPKNIYFRPKNWAKDHTDMEPRYLGLLGTKEITHNETLDSTLQVQDLSSQFICDKIKLIENDLIWDVCSGAGGKSLNLASKQKGVFFLSDIRPQILMNAKNRLTAMHYEASFSVLDATQPIEKLTFNSNQVSQKNFDVIIADVPCSGSGTWFRTPEHFSRFDYDTVNDFVIRQKSIVSNTLPYLKKGGVYYYLTCSIFQAENKDLTNWILNEFEVELEDEICFDGLKHRSDAMYMASFLKT